MKHDLDLPSSFKLFFVGYVVVILAVLGFAAWVIVKILQHFGII